MKKILFVATGGTIASKNRKWSDSADHAGRIDILYPGGGEDL